MGQFGWNDFLDIVILTVLLYKLIVWTKGTRAYEVIKGVGLLFVCSVLAQFLSLYTISWILSSILQSGSIIIVLFILEQQVTDFYYYWSETSKRGTMREE